MIDNSGHQHDYMGDGVYIEYDGYGYMLRANNHQDALCTDRIYLEPDVLAAINRFSQRMKDIKNDAD